MTKNTHDLSCIAVQLIVDFDNNYYYFCTLFVDDLDVDVEIVFRCCYIDCRIYLPSFLLVCRSSAEERREWCWGAAPLGPPTFSFGVHVHGYWMYLCRCTLSLLLTDIYSYFILAFTYMHRISLTYFPLYMLFHAYISSPLHTLRASSITLISAFSPVVSIIVKYSPLCSFYFLSLISCYGKVV